MAKHVFRFPIGRLLLALLCCVNSSIGGQSRSGLRSNPILAALLHWSSRDSTTTLSYSLVPVLETWMADGRLIPELCSFACEFQSGHGCIYRKKSRFIIKISGTIRISTRIEETSISIGKSTIRAAYLNLVSQFLGTSVLVVAFSLRKRFQR